MDWDAIIVGAGPAGSALACRLRPRRRVLLLDRQASSGSAIRIGESLPGAARVLLQRIGIFDRFLAGGHVERSATVSAWDGEAPVWFDHLRDPNGPGWHLDRTHFDRCLRAAAVEAGAVLIEPCGRLRVSHAAGGWQIALDELGQVQSAPILIDATGRSAAVARRIGLPRRVDDELICLHAYLPADPGDDDRCTRICADSNGWWYSVRVPSGRRVLAYHLDVDDPELGSLRAPACLLAKAQRQPLLAGVLPRYLDVPVHARPAGSAVLDADAMLGAPGFLAIGDAVHAFDPIASQGLFNALASAESAAEAIERHDADPASGRRDYLAEMSAVSARYRQHLHATYAGVVRHRHHRFWSRRLGTGENAGAI